VSSYGLTVEPRTALGRQVERAQVAPAPEESHEGEFLLVHAALQGAGYDHYEVSNYARPGAASRHNRAYWSGRPYVGLGPSAHGFDGGNRRWNITAFAHWAREVERDRDPVEGSEELTPGQRALEDLYLDLRTDRGVLTSASDDPIILPWMAAGWALRRGDRLLLTPTGWLRLDALVSALTDHRSRY
jgi:oxygen-independent coproporphyrinogen-3 oxidase